MTTNRLTISGAAEYTNLIPLDTHIQAVEPSTDNSEEQNTQEEVGTIENGYIIGNIVGRCSQVFNTSFVSIGDTKAKNEALLALSAFKEKAKKPQKAPQEIAKPAGMLPPSLRIDLWQFGESTEREQRAEGKYLSHFNDEERYFLKQQLGKVGHHFTTFEEYQDAENLRDPFDVRLLANDPPPPSKEVMEYIREETLHLEQEIADLSKDVDALQKQLNAQDAALQTSKKGARKSLLQARIDKLTKDIEPQEQLLAEKKKLLSKKQEQLSQAENNNNSSWSPLMQLQKDKIKRSKIYQIPIEGGEKHVIAQLKGIGALRRELNEIKQGRQKGFEQKAIIKVAQKLLELIREIGNNDLMSQTKEITFHVFQKSISPQKAIEELKKLLSQTYQQYFLQGREAPPLYLKQKNKDEILIAFKEKFGEERFAEVFNNLQSFLQEILLLAYPLEIIKREKITDDVLGKEIDLSESKVSEFPFCSGSLLETKNNTEINKLKASHTLAVDTYLKNRLPFALINLLQVDSSSCLARLFPGKKTGTSQVKFFFGTLNQAVTHYLPISITKISGGGSEFYLFETYQDRKIKLINPEQKTEEEFARFYNYYILIFDIPSIESLEHQLYQLRYANILVLDMGVKGNVETYTEQQVNALAQKAKEYLESADKAYGPAMRVLLLGNTRRMLTEFAQYLYPGMNKDEAFEALKSKYITPGNPTFALNYARVSIPNPGQKPISVVLLALRMPNGSLAGKATRSLLVQSRVDYLVTVGAGGSINYRTPIGGYEFIYKSYICDRQGKPIKSVNLERAYKKGHVLIPPNATPNSNITVSGPLLETGDWLATTKRNLTSISNVDVESFHILNAFNNAPSEGAYPYVTPALFISDHVGKKDASLSKIIGKAAYKDAYLLTQFIAQQIRKLHSPSPSLIPMPPSSKPQQYFIKTETLYAPPGEKDQEAVQVPIANIQHIAFTKENLGLIFQLINAVTVNRPYDSRATKDIEVPYVSAKTKLTAYRPNHNGTHSSRQARLVEAALPCIVQFGKLSMRGALNSLFSSPKNILALQLAAYCLRIGRCDESGWKLDGDNYNARSAEIFREYAKQLKIDPKIRELLAKYIRLSTFDDNQAEINNEQDRLVHAVLSLVHELDLIRLFPADKFKNKVYKHLQTLLQNNEDIEKYANTLIKFSQNLSIATGGTLRNARSPLQNEEEFTINSTYGGYCWKTVQNIPLPRI